jgi:glycosyltransferase involved in cell wall biosynthesis
VTREPHTPEAGDDERALAALHDTLERLKARAVGLGLGTGVTTELEGLIDQQRALLDDTRVVAREVAAIRNSRTWRVLEHLRRWRLRFETTALALRHSRSGRGRRRGVPTAVKARPPAVNVSGYITAESGMGEAVRSSIRALQHAGIPVALDNVASAQRTHDTTYSGFTTALSHSFNLIHLNADNMATFARTKGRAYFRDRYTIGFWFWELASFRREWMPAFRFVDEVWVASQFTKACFDAVSPVPVTHIPLAVPPLSPQPADKATFGIQDRGVALLFVFDVSSQAERKNPVAVIRAFREAGFARDDATLVLKFTNPAFDRAAVRRLHQEASGLNVLFLDGFMSRGELTSLVNVCDAYVSLHRAEGFGLTMLEAMALGKPVIATGYSANVDFMTADNSHLVGYRLVELDRNSGPYPRGFTWAEPDVSHAAQLMRAVATDPAAARQRGLKAAADVRTRFSLPVVAERIRQRITAIASPEDSRT